MKKIIQVLFMLLCTQQVFAQHVYQIRADSVRIYNVCDTAELIIENRTRGVSGFLYNKGSGVTEFRRIQLESVGNGQIAIIGQDTLDLSTLPGIGGIDTIYRNGDNIIYVKKGIQTIINLPYSPIGHTHDDRYYTKTNLQTIGQALVHWDNISSKPSFASTETLQSVTNRGSSTTNNILFNSSSGNPSNGPVWNYNTDSWKIFVESAADTPPGNMIFEANGDDTEGWIFRSNATSEPAVKDILSLGRNRFNYKGNVVWHANNHPAGSAFTPTLTGANVLSTLTINSAGHITALTTRTLTSSDINAAPANIPLSAVLANGNTAPNSITLGAAGNTNSYLLNIVRRVGTTDFTTTFGTGLTPVVNNGQAVMQISNGTVTKYLALAHSDNAPIYTPDGGTNRYTMWHANNHPAGNAVTPTLTGANVLSTLTVNSAGHISALTTRALTATDISAAPASGSANYINNTTSAQVTSNFFISGQGVTNGNFQVRKDGASTISGGITLYNAAATRGVNFQLNEDTNPGLAAWVHDGAVWQKRMELFAVGGMKLGGGNGVGINLDGPSSIVRDNGIDIKINTNRLGINQSGTAAATLDIGGNVKIGTIPAQGTAATTYLTSNSGIISSRTTAQMLTDIGAASSVIPLQTVLANGRTSTLDIDFISQTTGVGWWNGSNRRWLLRQDLFPASDFTLYRYNDAGTPSTVWTISRATGVVNFTSVPLRGGNTMWDANNHPAGSANSQGAGLTGATVYSNIVTNSAGHLTSVSTRNLTASDIGAAPASASGSYIQNGTGLQSASNFYVTGTGRSNSNFIVSRSGSNTIINGLELRTADLSRGGIFQLNGDATPGISTWIHNGTAWTKRIETNATTGETSFFGAVKIDGGTLALSNASSNNLLFSNGGLGAPSVNTRSVGTKITLSQSLSSTLTDYAIGIESSHIWFSVPTAGGGFKWYGNTAQIARLDGAGNMLLAGQMQATAFYQSSKRSLKKNIVAFNASALDILNKAQVRSFQFKADSTGHTNIGFIADEVPEEISTPGRTGVDQASTVGLLVKSIQELSARNEALENRVKKLETAIEKLLEAKNK